jgi:hypothetical protein
VETVIHPQAKKQKHYQQKYSTTCDDLGGKKTFSSQKETQ